LLFDIGFLWGREKGHDEVFEPHPSIVIDDGRGLSIGLGRSIGRGFRLPGVHR
jgi:hypothetical protein